MLFQHLHIYIIILLYKFNKQIHIWHPSSWAFPLKNMGQIGRGSFRIFRHDAMPKSIRTARSPWRTTFSAFTSWFCSAARLVERTCGRCNTKICQEWILSNIWTYWTFLGLCAWNICKIRGSGMFRSCSHFPHPWTRITFILWRKQIWQLRRASLWILPACLRQHCCPGAAFRFN